MITDFLFPAVAPDPPNAAQILIAGQGWFGRVPVLPNLGITLRRHGDVFYLVFFTRRVKLALIIGAIPAHLLDWAWGFVQQLPTGFGVIDAGSSQTRQSPSYTWAWLTLVGLLVIALGGWRLRRARG